MSFNCSFVAVVIVSTLEFSLMSPLLCFSDETLVRVQAQVMTRDDSSGGWVPMGGGGLSYVGLVRRAHPDDRKNEYVILGQRIVDNSVRIWNSG